jgi:hypothetical protein
MDSLVLHPTSVSQWHALVSEGELACALELGEDLESYLVFLLMRYINKPEIATTVLAIEFFESMKHLGALRWENLQIIGDKCLLFGGLFPERALRKRVGKHYFVDLGQTAYYELANVHTAQRGKLYSLLCEHFVPMQNVLHAMSKQRLPELKNFQSTLHIIQTIVKH